MRQLKYGLLLIVLFVGISLGYCFPRSATPGNNAISAIAGIAAEGESFSLGKPVEGTTGPDLGNGSHVFQVTLPFTWLKYHMFMRVSPKTRSQLTRKEDVYVHAILLSGKGEVEREYKGVIPREDTFDIMEGYWVLSSHGYYDDKDVNLKKGLKGGVYTLVVRVKSLEAPWVVCPEFVSLP